MNKYLLILILIMLSITQFIFASGLSLSFSESVRSPLLDDKPIDYEITFATKYDDNIDIYYCQERDNGLNNTEYWVEFQGSAYKSLWVSGKRQYDRHNDLWLADLKLSIDSNGWKTFIGFSNCWENEKYKPKALLEESKMFSFNFFLTPFDLVIHTKLLADTHKLYHEERIDLRFLINLPTSWEMSKYINTYIKLFILSKDYNYYRWQQKLMLEVNFK